MIVLFVIKTSFKDFIKNDSTCNSMDDMLHRDRTRALPLACGPSVGPCTRQLQTPRAHVKILPLPSPTQC